MEDVADLKMKLSIAEGALRFIVGINKKQLDSVPGYVKIRMCRESAILALEALKLKSINKNKIGKFENISETCPWCGATVRHDWGTGVEYQCDNAADRLSGVTYKYCQHRARINNDLQDMQRDNSNC